MKSTLNACEYRTIGSRQRSMIRSLDLRTIYVRILTYSTSILSHVAFWPNSRSRHLRLYC